MLTKPPVGVMDDPSHPLSQGCVCHLLMNEGTGSGVYDVSGHANHGALKNILPNVQGSGWGGSKIGGGLNFDGSNDFVDCGNTSFLSNKKGSMEFWAIYEEDLDSFFAVSDFSSGGRFLYFLTETGGTGWNNDRLRLVSYDGAWDYSLYTPEDSFFPNRRYHVAATSDGSTIKIYINGVNQTLTAKEGSNNGNWFGDLTGADKATIGTLYYMNGSISSPLKGQIDGLRIFDRALNAKEVMTLYRDPFCNVMQTPIWQRYIVAAALARSYGYIF